MGESTLAGQRPWFAAFVERLRALELRSVRHSGPQFIVRTMRKRALPLIIFA